MGRQRSRWRLEVAQRGPGPGVLLSSRSTTSTYRHAAPCRCRRASRWRRRPSAASSAVDGLDMVSPIPLRRADVRDPAGPVADGQIASHDVVAPLLLPLSVLVLPRDGDARPEARGVSFSTPLRIVCPSTRYIRFECRFPRRALDGRRGHSSVVRRVERRGRLPRRVIAPIGRAGDQRRVATCLVWTCAHLGRTVAVRRPRHPPIVARVDIRSRGRRARAGCDRTSPSRAHWGDSDTCGGDTVGVRFGRRSVSTSRFVGERHRSSRRSPPLSIPIVSVCVVVEPL